MRKITICILAVLLVMGCHCSRKSASPEAQPAPEQTVIEAAPNTQPASDVKTVQPVQTAPAASVAATAAQTTPVAKTAATTQPATVATPKKTTAAAAAATTTKSAATKTPAKTAPAPFKPTFKDEETIDTKDRLLHPYAALAPDPKAPQNAPWAYEQLKFGIYYSFVKAGTAYIHNRGIVSIDGRPTYLFQTTAFSATVIDTVFKVRDINQSWLDAAELYSRGYDQSVREGNYKRDEWVTFDYAAKKYKGQVQKKHDPRNISGPLDIKVLDMLTSMYYVRAAKLEVGKDVVFDIINREKQYPLIVKVLKKETVKTPAGKFNCIVVEPQLRGEGIFVAKGKSLKVWLTDDQYKMPVKMTVEVFIGSVSAELLEYQRQAPANIL